MNAAHPSPNEYQDRIVDRTITDEQKIRLFLCAIKAKAMAEDAMERDGGVPPHIGAFASEMETRWQEARRTALAYSSDEASAALKQFAQPLEEGLRTGETELQRSFLNGEDIQERFIFWWLLRLYRDRVVALETEMKPLAQESELMATNASGPEPIDEEALSSFAAAMELVV